MVPHENFVETIQWVCGNKTWMPSSLKEPDRRFCGATLRWWESAGDSQSSQSEELRAQMMKGTCHRDEAAGPHRQ
jgi:hypothetical protein